MLGGCFHLGFSGFWDHPHPPQLGEGPGPKESQTVKNWNTAKLLK